jgi:hypothetical protein
MSTIARMGSLILLLLATASAHASVSELSGTAPGGSAWRIAVPEGWSAGDGLVLVQHGYRFGKVLTPSLGPSAQAMLDDGYAIAAPGYRQSGWAVRDAIDDNAELLHIFRAQVGEPGTVLAHGGSMGALIALKLAEDKRLRTEIDGVLALCPVADGVGWWDRLFDLRLAYDVVCRDVPGGALPVGDAPMPWASNLDVLQQAPVDTQSYPASIRALPAVRACLGLERSDAQRDAGMRDRIATLKTVAGTQDEDALAAQLVYAHFGLAHLLRDADQLAGINPFYNRVPFGSPQTEIAYRLDAWRDGLPAGFDADVARIDLDDIARLRFHKATSLEGSIRVPVLSSHTRMDGVAMAGAQQRFLHQRLETPIALALVDDSTPSHCGYTTPEYDALWKALREWVEYPLSPRPDAASLQASCNARATGACRFDTQLTADVFLIPTIREPRYPLVDYMSSIGGGNHASIATAGGLWRNVARPAQGILIEELDDIVGGWNFGEQRVALSWFTWAPASDPNPGARWLHGIGRVYEHAIVVDDVLEVRGGRFGVLLDPAQISYVRWGRIEIGFGRERPLLRYEGPSAWGSGEIDLQQLTTAGLGLNNRIALSPPMSADFVRSGTYYHRARPAGGWILNQFGNSYEDTRSMLLWFTWDANGRPLWMFGIDEEDEDGLQFQMQWAAGGGRFEPGYTQADVRMLPWGDVVLEGDTCDDGRVTAIGWRAATHGFGDGRVPAARLTAPTLLHADPYCPR